MSMLMRSTSVIVTGMVKTILGYVPGQWDPSYARTEVWTTVHTCIAIVCANLPILMPLIQRMKSSSFVLSLRSKKIWSLGRRSNSVSEPMLSGSERNRHRRSSNEHVNVGIELPERNLPS